MMKNQLQPKKCHLQSKNLKKNLFLLAKIGRMILEYVVRRHLIEREENFEEELEEVEEEYKIKEMKTMNDEYDKFQCERN